MSAADRLAAANARLPTSVTSHISNVPALPSTTSTLTAGSENRSPNATLTGSGNTQQSSSTPSNSHTEPTIIAGVVAGVGAIVLTALLILLWTCLRRRKNKSNEMKRFDIQTGSPAIHGAAQAGNEGKLHCPSQDTRIPPLLLYSCADVFPLRWSMVLQLCFSVDLQGRVWRWYNVAQQAMPPHVRRDRTCL